jgi:hypothetical protein
MPYILRIQPSFGNSTSSSSLSIRSTSEQAMQSTILAEPALRSFPEAKNGNPASLQPLEIAADQPSPNQ